MGRSGRLPGAMLGRLGYSPDGLLGPSHHQVFLRARHDFRIEVHGHLVDNPDLAARYGQAGLEIAAENAPEPIGRQWLDLMHGLASSRPRPP